MKWVLILTLFIISSCATQSTADSNNLQTNRNDSTNSAENTQALFEESIKINKENVEKLELQNKKFEVVPAEFKNVDFNNFTFPTDYPKKSVTLKNNEFEYEINDKKTGGRGGGNFYISKVFYVDLTSDKIKEALVFLFRVDCGGSCDGGSYLIYIYNTKQNKPNLIWNLFLGSQAYDCGLKNLSIKEMRISFVTYSECVEKNHELVLKEGTKSSGKGYAYGLTEFSYRFDGKKFIREKMQSEPQDYIGHINILPEVSIED